MANDIIELNGVLFDTLRKLQANKIDPDQAKAITGVAQTIINSAKVQSDHQKLVGKDDTPVLFEKVINPLTIAK